MTSVINIDGHQSLHSLQDEGEMESKVEISERACGNHGGICAICLDKIVLQETALIKGCEHAIRGDLHLCYESRTASLLRSKF
ncbi:hypothetical protein NC651_002795 [Populus alba x Populus x berolinensis]|nr:hypothetical protein NC651_002795 [Populus alba x Populus x berolinensis]